MKQNRDDLILVSDIPVKPFESVKQAVDSIIDDSGKVTSGVAIAINPEKIMASRSSEEVKNILLAADFPYADGIGVVKVLRQKTGRLIQRIPGVQLWLETLIKASSFNKRVFLIGGSNDVILATVNKLMAEYSTNVVGYEDGYYKNETHQIERIADSKPDIVIVALGSPKQELFIDKCKNIHPNAFYMGVGGSFDVFTGRVKRAPKFWINLNLEWLYRLLCQPTRIFRQVTLLKFLYLYLSGRL